MTDQSTAVAEQKQTSLAEVMEQVEERFIQIAPEGMLFAREKGFAVQLLDQNEYLAKISRQDNYRSLLQAMTNVAAIGLSLNPAKRQAYLIPRGGRIFLEPSYMGLCDIATATGIIEWVQADNVYSNDSFELQGLDKPPIHNRDPFLTQEQRGDYRGAYCTAKMSSGDYLTTVMSAEEIHSVRDRSEAWKRNQSGPWKTDFGEQAKKTVVRRAFKMWPKTNRFDRLETAVHLSNENEGFEPIVNSPSLRDYSPEQKEHFDYLIENGDGIGMHCFMTSLDEGVQTSLYNSFEKGTITKYKKLVSELQQKGHSQLVDIETVIGEAMSSGDDMAAKEVLEDLSQEAVEFLANRNDSEFGSFVRQCQQELAA